MKPFLRVGEDVGCFGLQLYYHEDCPSIFIPCVDMQYVRDAIRTLTKYKLPNHIERIEDFYELVGDIELECIKTSQTED
jgi:hypothetical protein